MKIFYKMLFSAASLGFMFLTVEFAVFFACCVVAPWFKVEPLPAEAVTSECHGSE